MYYMSNTKKNNKQHNNKTKKKRFYKPFGLTEYLLRFKNTEILPKSDIIYYMINNFNNYAEYSIICEAINTHPLILEDCFNIKPNDFPNNFLMRSNVLCSQIAAGRASIGLPLCFRVSATAGALSAKRFTTASIA